jgi:hypothetical protein
MDTNERIARNETLFREVNERVRDVQTPGDEWIGFLCECGNADCTSTVDLSVQEYEAVRADATTFVLLPGHDIPQVEEVIETTERFVVVRKYPSEAAEAIETDPRAAS